MFVSWISNLFLTELYLFHLKGYLEISASVSQHQHLYCHCKSSIFAWPVFFEVASQDFYLCLVIRHQYHFATNTHFSTISYPPNQGHLLVLKKAALIFGSNLPLMLRKNICFEHFWKLASKTPMVNSFPRVFAGLPGSFLKSCLE